MHKDLVGDGLAVQVAMGTQLEELHVVTNNNVRELQTDPLEQRRCRSKLPLEGWNRPSSNFFGLWEDNNAAERFLCLNSPPYSHVNSVGNLIGNSSTSIAGHKELILDVDEIVARFNRLNVSPCTSIRKESIVRRPSLL